MSDQKALTDFMLQERTDVIAESITLEPEYNRIKKRLLELSAKRSCLENALHAYDVKIQPEPYAKI